MPSSLGSEQVYGPLTSLGFTGAFGHDIGRTRVGCPAQEMPVVQSTEFVFKGDTVQKEQEDTGRNHGYSMDVSWM